MRSIITFCILFLFWVLLSGHLDLWHLCWGAICTATVTYLSRDLLFKGRLDLRSKGKESWRFLKYLPWLLGQIFKANLHVARLALHPRMGELVDPRIIRFRTRLKKDLSLVTFANSITLTPGTITVLIEGDRLYVHAIDRTSAEALPGEMEMRVAEVYEER